jgi:hypothetical protein
VRHVWQHDGVFVKKLQAPPDLDYIYDGLMSALRAVVQRKKLGDGILVGPFGRSSTVAQSLSLASNYLDSPFHDEDTHAVDKACRAVGISCPSHKQNEIAQAIFEKLAKKH